MKVSSDLRKYLDISRPTLWIWLLGPYLLGIAVSIHSDFSAVSIIGLIYWGLFFSLPANLFLYGIENILKQRLHESATEQHTDTNGAESEVSKTTRIIMMTCLFSVVIGQIIYLPDMARYVLFAFLILGVIYSRLSIMPTNKVLRQSIICATYITPALFAIGALGNKINIFTPAILLIAVIAIYVCVDKKIIVA